MRASTVPEAVALRVARCPREPQTATPWRSGIACNATFVGTAE